MSAFKIFLTGATGYIGGDILYLLAENQPTWQIVCLVRDPAKSSDLVARYPGVHVVHGDLDSVDLIEEQAANANLTIHTANCDHVASAQAIARGLQRSRSTLSYWIHTSGTGILTHQNFSLNNFETECGNGKVYDDWEHVEELTSLPDKALHRHVDKIVLAASIGHEDRVKTAIICPPAIYGMGRGTGNTRSVQVNKAVRLALLNRQALQMGDGKSIWHSVHVRDLSRLYLMLAEAAASGWTKASWNAAGYYLAENGSFTWGSLAQWIADEGLKRGYLFKNTVQSMNFEQAQKQDRLFPYLCGTTSRGVSKRARILLGWKPVHDTLMSELPRIIEDEANQLGIEPLIKGSRL